MPAFLAPLIISALVGGFAKGIIEGIIKSLLSIGIGFAVYQGIDVLMASISSHIFVNLSSISPEIKGMLGLMKVDKCLNVLSSAFAVRLVLKGVTNGVSRKLEIKE